AKSPSWIPQPVYPAPKDAERTWRIEKSCMRRPNHSVHVDTRELKSSRKNGLSHELQVPALRVRQGKNRILFSFAVDGKLLSRFVTITRVSRAASGVIAGYQRPEVLSHINEIRSYLESDDPMIPNAVVVAFDDRVRFEPLDVDSEHG